MGAGQGHAQSYVPPPQSHAPHGSPHVPHESLSAGSHHSQSDLDHIIAATNPEHVHTFKPSHAELQKLQTQFRSLKQSSGGSVAEKLDREAFHHNFAKKLKPQFIDKIFNALDWDHSGVVSFREFVMLTHILFAGSDDEKIDYLFVLYDQNGNGYLSIEELGRLAHGSAAAMRALLHNLRPESHQGKQLTAEDKDSAEKLLAQKILKEADKDKDGQINIAEFKSYCKRHPEMLQELAQLRDLLHHVLGDEAKKIALPGSKSPLVRNLVDTRSTYVYLQLGRGGDLDVASLSLNGAGIAEPASPVVAAVTAVIPNVTLAAAVVVEAAMKKDAGSQSPKPVPKIPPKHSSEAELFELASHNKSSSSTSLEKLTT